MLVLPIKKKWFDMIRSGEKKEEYREIKPYWTSRLERFLSIIKPNCSINATFNVILKNGYKKDSPQLECSCKLRVGQGKEEWGAEPGKEYYILKIQEVLSIQNVK